MDELIKVVQTLPGKPKDFPTTAVELKRIAESSASEYEPRNFACPPCMMSFTEEELRAHMAVHRNQLAAQNTPEARAQRAEKAMSEQGVYDEHLRWRLADFPRERPVVDASLAEGKGILINGVPDARKSSLLAAILFDRLYERKNCRVLLAAEIFREIRATYSADSPVSERAVIEAFIDYDFLGIEDLGFEGKPSDAVVSVLHEIISKRNGKRLTTAVTTNLPLAAIGGRYGEAIRSRVASWAAVHMEFAGWRER